MPRKKAKPNPVGRPSKYDPAFCQVAVEFLAEGYSVKALAGHLSVAYSTVKKWGDENPEFSAALKTGQAKAALWWEDTLRQVGRTGQGSAAAAIFGVKNRSQELWKDKQEMDHTSSDGSMTPKKVERVVVKVGNSTDTDR